MYKGHRLRIINKNPYDNWSLKNNNPTMFSCSKCNKYNSIFDSTQKYMNCIYCGNPNYIKK